MKENRSDFGEGDALRRVRFRVDPHAYDDLVRKIRILNFAGLISKDEMEFASKTPDVARWLSKIGWSSRTVYVKNLLYYMRCVNLTSLQLLQLKISEDRNLLFYPAEDLLEAWIKAAENGGVKPSRIEGVVHATRSFYNHNRLTLADVDYAYCPEEKPDITLVDLKRFRKGFDFFGAENS